MSTRRMLTVPLALLLVIGMAAPAAATARAPQDAAVAQNTAPVRDVTLASNTASAKVLRVGDKGKEIKKLQKRLRKLKYWVGPIDGVFGHLTQQALFAFQKTQGLQVDGVYGPQTRKALKNPKKVGVRSKKGKVAEVDKKRQVLKLARGGKVKWIFNTSTGTEKPYKHEGKKLMADTPKGKYKIFRQVKGWRDGELGRLYNPKYFHADGIAIHGYHSVPPYPASHGCARISMDASRFLWKKLKIGTRVWVY